MRVPGPRPSRPGADESCRSGEADGMLSLPAVLTHEEGLSSETGILGFWDNTVPISGRTREDTVYSSTARYSPEEPVFVIGSCTGTSRCIGGSERPS